MMADTELKASLKIQASVAGADKIKVLAHDISDMSDELEMLGKQAHKADDALDDLSAQSDNTTNTAGKLKTAFGGLAGVLGALGISYGAKEVIELADAYTNLESRVRLATGGGEAFVSAMHGIKQIANNTRSDLESTGVLFNRLSQASGELGLSQQELLGLTTTINQAMQVSGASTDEASSAILQLSQGLASGVLRGEEFNSIMENGGRLADAMAQGLGVTKGELRAMAGEGKLTADVVVNAIKSQVQLINTEFASMPMTVASSVQVLKNNLLSLVGELNGGSDSTARLAGFIGEVSEGLAKLDPKTLNILKNTASSAGDAFGAVFGAIGALWNAIELNFAAVTGQMDEGEQGVGVLARALQGVNVVLGIFSDGVNAIAMAFRFAHSVGLEFVGALSTALSKITFGDLSKDLAEFGNDLKKTGDELQDKLQNDLLHYQSATQKALNATALSAEQMAQAASQASDEAIKSFERLAKSGEVSGEALADSFGEALNKAATVEAIEGIKQQYTELAEQGAITGEQLADGMALTQQKMDELRQTVGTLAGDIEGLADSSQSVQDKLQDTAKSLELDFDKASLSATAAMDEMAKGVLSVAGEFDELQTAGLNASELITQGLQKMAGSIKNEADFALVTELIAKMGDEGKLSGDKLSRALAASRKKADELGIGIDDVAKAYKAMGIASTSELQKQASEYTAHYQTILNDATATESIKRAAFEKYAQAVLDGNDGIITSELQLQAQKHGFASIVSEQGKLITATSEQIVQTRAKEASATEKASLAHQKYANTAATANKQIADSTKETSQAVQATTNNVQSYGRSMAAALAQMADAGKAPLRGLTDDMQAVNEAYSQFMEKVYAKGADSIEGGLAKMGRGHATLKKMADGFHAVKQAVDDTASSLSGTAVSMDAINKAQGVLNQGMQANIQGIIRLDQSKLDNLKRQIESAREQMQALADDAKNTADSLEGELASMQGDGVRAVELDNAKKLKDIQDKINAAKKRGNADEIAQLQRAMNLQTQINAKKIHDARQTGQTNTSQANSNQASNSVSSSSSQVNQSSQANTGNTNASSLMGNLTASEVASSFNALIKQAEARGAQNFAQQLSDEAKRMAR